ncbi:MAG: hypothetical protein ACJ8EH_07655 [Sphingomicrobium sp.]
MEKRPLSLTIIAWFLIIFSLFGLYGVATMGSNPIALKMIEQMHTSVVFQQVWGTIGALINIACAYGILKGQPWSRVLYVVWGAIGIVVSFFIAPMKAVIVLSIVFFVVIAAFLYTNTANDWFQARGFMLKRERSR